MTIHEWAPTTNTFAVFKCTNCAAVAFAPHALPKFGCPDA